MLPGFPMWLRIGLLLLGAVLFLWFLSAATDDAHRRLTTRYPPTWALLESRRARDWFRRFVVIRAASLLAYFAPTIYSGYVPPLQDLSSQRRLEEKVDRLLQSFGERVRPERLLRKFPLGYVIFEVDHMNQVPPYDRRLLDEYEVDWSVVRLKDLGDRVDLRLPDFRHRGEGGALADVHIVLPKQVTGLGAGAQVGDLAIVGELVAIRETGIVFVIGFMR
ncbi:MAG: hypothetical protein ACREJ9_12585 [Candidatus Rokuibacteriota bacterium]